MSARGGAKLLIVSLFTLAGSGSGSVFSFYLPSSNNVKSDCTSADESPGVCTEITSCKSLGDFWEKPITKEKIKFLQLSTCGFANDVPKICCPIDTRSISRRTVKATTTITTVPTTTTTQATTTTEPFRITEE